MRRWIPLALMLAIVLTLIGLGVFGSWVWLMYMVLGVAELVFALVYARGGGHRTGVGLLALVGVAQLAQAVYWSRQSADSIAGAIPIDNVGVAFLMVLTILAVAILPMKGEQF